ncbi:MAG: hypothetical protein ACR2KG_06750 [Nocardioidaceae bacterium]
MRHFKHLTDTLEVVWCAALIEGGLRHVPCASHEPHRLHAAFVEPDVSYLGISRHGHEYDHPAEAESVYLPGVAAECGHGNTGGFNVIALGCGDTQFMLVGYGSYRLLEQQLVRPGNLVASNEYRTGV